MANNRLLPQQFAPGNTVDATRIEQALQALCALYDDVPADLVQRRWSPSPMCWGLLPSRGSTDIRGVSSLPFLSDLNDSTQYATLQPPTAAQITNLHRVKSNQAAPAVSTGAQTRTYTMETTFLASHPCIIGDLTCMAAFELAGLPAYINQWLYGAVPPFGKVANSVSTDFTLQVCVSDAWDLENRKKLRQESLVYQMRSDAFLFSPGGVGAATDSVLPPHPCGVFEGFAVSSSPMILVPAGGRVLFQWSIPQYATLALAQWGPTPWRENVWSLSTRIWSPTR